jgi:3-hydroxyisobutyrate dehydrogenase
LFASRLLQAGCSVASTAAEAIAASDVVVLVLSDAAAIRSTLLEDAEATAALSGKWILQMGTIGPAESISIAADVEAAGGQYMEAPVLGSQPEAEKGTLLVMVGSKESPEGSPAGTVLKAFCEKANYIGQVYALIFPFLPSPLSFLAAARLLSLLQHDAHPQVQCRLTPAGCLPDSCSLRHKP